MPEFESGELAGRRRLLAVDIPNATLHPVCYRPKQSFHIVGQTFGNQVNTTIREILNISRNRVKSGYRQYGVSKANTLNQAGIVHITPNQTLCTTHESVPWIGSLCSLQNPIYAAIPDRTSLDWSSRVDYLPSAMSRHLPNLPISRPDRLKRSALVLLVLALASKPLLLAQESGEVLLLRTGGVLRGQIERQPDHYVVTTAHREIRLLSRDVETVCHSLTEAYSIQRAALNEDSPDDHITLAQWCIRHDLWAAAAQELLDARRLDPQHPRLAVTEQRLALAARPKKDPLPSPSPGQQTSQTGHPTVLEEDRTTGPSEKSSPSTRYSPDIPRSEPLSPQAIKTFTESIQPLLLNTCTTSGCHQTGGYEAFQLDRSALGWTGDRRRTIRNLQATLDWIDDEHPEKSPLLIAASQAHGSLDSPPITVHQTQYLSKLTFWVLQVCEKTNPSSSSIQEDLALPSRPPLDHPPAGDDAQAGREEQAKNPLIRKGPQRGIQLRRVRSVDPVDRKTDPKIHATPMESRQPS